MAVLVEYSDKLQRAVDLVVAPLGVHETQQNAKSGRSTFTDRRGGGSSGGYNGYFKVEIFPKNNNTVAVRVYNGAKSFPQDVDLNKFNQYKAGVCMVNGIVYEVEPFYKEYDQNQYPDKYFLKFTYGAGANGKSTVAIVDSFNITTPGSRPPTNGYPSGTNTVAWYLLAEIVDGVLIQQHTSSMPQLFWFRDCNEEI